MLVLWWWRSHCDDANFMDLTWRSHKQVVMKVMTYYCVDNVIAVLWQLCQERVSPMKPWWGCHLQDTRTWQSWHAVVIQVLPYSWEDRALTTMLLCAGVLSSARGGSVVMALSWKCSDDIGKKNCNYYAKLWRGFVQSASKRRWFVMWGLSWWCRDCVVMLELRVLW